MAIVIYVCKLSTNEVALAHQSIKLKRCLAKYELYQEYISYVEDVLNHPEVQRMADFAHHGTTSTLEHVMHVSYYTFFLCKKYGLDARAGARAGLLHDFFLYDWHEKEDPKIVHTLYHPKIALKNAEKYFELSDVEREMILLHMYPVVEGFKQPKYKETQVIQMVDKICAVSEVLKVVPKLVERRLQKIALGEAVSLGLVPVEVHQRRFF